MTSLNLSFGEFKLVDDLQTFVKLVVKIGIKTELLLNDKAPQTAEFDDDFSTLP